ncbi:MAG: DUF4403 family protein [Bacteroidota bacterium]
MILERSRLVSLFFLLVFLTTCGQDTEERTDSSGDNFKEYKEQGHESVDQSLIQLPLDYPVKDLEVMINRIMPDTLVNDTIKLNDKGDYVLLKVVPIGSISLDSYQNMLDASLPLNAIVFFKKKLGAINLTNKKAASLKLRIDLHTVLSLDESFNLNTNCTLQKVQWIDEPVLRVAGVRINLSKTITKQINKNSELMASAICRAINQTVPVKKEVKALWDIINEPHRVAQKPVKIWMSMTPKGFSAQFDKNVTDTLRINVQALTGIVITPFKGVNALDLPLPENDLVEAYNGLDLKVSLNIPYENLDLVINSRLDGQKLEYAGLTTVLTNFQTSGAGQKLNLQFQTKGDIEATLNVTAQPSLTTSKDLIFDHINYTVTSDNLIVNAIDWFSNSSIDSYISDYTKIPLAHILDSLDEKIVRGLDRKSLGSKIDLQLNFSTIESDSIFYRADRLEWLFSVEGNAHAYLSDSLVVLNQ